MSYPAAAVAALGCLLAVAPVNAGSVETLGTELVASGFNKPVGVFAVPGDYTRVIVMEKRGVFRVLNHVTGTIEPGTWLDINSIVGGSNSTNSEQGALGLAFHPDFLKNGYFYVYYTNNSGDTIISRYEVTTDPNNVDESTADPIMFIDQPFSNHNGGWIDFGPDGYLYVATGDGGSANDPGNRAQTITNQHLGKMLRIDVNGDDFPANAAQDYAIPSDNPFVGVAGDDEIWSYGLRNPWRCDFDNLTGQLYIADVGQNAREEINIQPASSDGGENYGWRCYEGNNPFNTAGCDPAGTMVFPVQTYTHTVGLSVTGGHVYRGCKIPTLDGHYFYSDWITDRIWSFKWDLLGGGVTEFAERTTELNPPGSDTIINMTSFGEDLRGELYICEQTTNGAIYRIVSLETVFSPSDSNCDGEVNVIDMLLVLAEWGTAGDGVSSIGSQADVNGDDEVDVLDLLQTLADWT